MGHPATATAVADPYGMTTKKGNGNSNGKSLRDDNQKGNSNCTADPLRGLFLAEDVSHAAYLGADAAEFFFEVLVAAIEVVDAI